MLGISLYPDKTQYSQDQRYLSKAKEWGYEVVFMSLLQINPDHPKQSIQRIKQSIDYAHELGFTITMDIHPMVFQLLHIEDHDLRYFHDMGIDTLRFDSGMDGRIEAKLTRNPYDIKIEINMSNDTHYLDYILDYHPNLKNLQGSHNFYPQRYTGLSKDSFLKCSKRFQEHHLPSAVFVNSQCAKVSPWPIDEGLCTLEQHRDVSLDVQVQHLCMMKVSDSIIIANVYASDQELQLVKESYERSIPHIHVEFNEQATAFEKKLVLDQVHEYRGDASAYVIRSSKARRIYGQDPLPAHLRKTKIKRGDILILNEKYGQYKAELQLSLQDRESDEKINVVGHIVEKEWMLMEELRPFQNFVLKELEK